MLNSYDISWMEDTVRSVIREWNTSITIYSRLPMEYQTNYDKLMREFVGPMECSSKYTYAERKDMVNNNTYSYDNKSTEYGITDDGKLVYTIPDMIDGVRYTPHINDIATISDGDSGDIYYISDIRNRIGEVLLTIGRFVGSKPVISTIGGKVFIDNYDWGGNNG